MFTYLVSNEGVPEDARTSLVSAALCAYDPQATYDLDQDFRAFVLKNYREMPAFTGPLAAWLAQAEQSEIKELHAFTSGLRKDLAAVTAGLSQHWNSGPVEGAVTRIKLLKRQSCGRAGFDLLRRRILLAT
ncbi:transposase [Streptomyces synnematoformans]|uniref:transposase n=1 Tax=Streptomyces synnematoformans TaxID=415721 RepID=UPI0031D3856E